ncbi:hypothetical protein NP233_g4989 [Leucocoprinus birnbaumii]|uniref:Costars domain-containing protein n=1 Tax=Leucocoprinus birnbaumii TaxID=56174 RepID=A0AAD5VTS0_9AGAR|nr:hypothetical protein NP233_g4989 [Leucocoprinus birnbaumii]
MPPSNTTDFLVRSYPAYFLDVKREIASSYPNFEARITQAWKEIIAELDVVTNQIHDSGSNYIPQIDFGDIDSLSIEEVAKIKKRGCVVIRNVVDDEKVIGWRESLREFARRNPGIEGFPADDKQFFELYWTKPQVEARADPNFLKACIWLNNLYHDKSGAVSDKVDLDIPLIYADRYRIRKPGSQWGFLPPHVDGGTIERWQDPTFRKCFDDILSGNWRQHDPYDLAGRLDARASLYDRPGQASVFRTFQGWLSMSETGPTEGTIQLVPEVLLSNAYLILRPFFKPTVAEDSPEVLKAENWTIDLESPEFPGIIPMDGGFAGPYPNPLLHPHLALAKTLLPAPNVQPGDAVFWHCDLIHAVESTHEGKEDSAVMYIPAVPYTTQNSEYVKKQLDAFLNGERPSDFPKGKGEAGFIEAIKKYGAKNSDGNYVVPYGVLSDNTTQIFEALNGTLRSAKKQKKVAFDKELLMLPGDKDVPVVLLEE